MKLSENEGYLRNLIYGTHENERYDGIHLAGGGSSRHFTYRAIQKMKPIISKPNTDKEVPSSFRAQNANDDNKKDDHTNCQQQTYWDYMSQSASRSQRRRTDKPYSEVLKGPSRTQGNSTFTLPTRNFFNPLNC